MPPVRIDLNEGRTPEDLRQLSRGIHEAILAECGIPERAYFHGPSGLAARSTSPASWPLPESRRGAH